ncbi:MAG: SMI1/KNR4 family protein [Bacteroidota bacterium]
MTYQRRKEYVEAQYHQIVPRYFKKSGPPKGYTEEEIQQAEKQLNVQFPDSLRFGLKYMRDLLFYGFKDMQPVNRTLDKYAENKALMLAEMKDWNYTCPFDVNQIIVFQVWEEGMSDGSYPEVYLFINAQEGENPQVYTFTGYRVDGTETPILLQKLGSIYHPMSVLDSISHAITGLSIGLKDE